MNKDLNENQMMDLTSIEKEKMRNTVRVLMELVFKTLKDDFDSAYTLFRIRARVEDNDGNINREDSITLLELSKKSLQIYKSKIEELERDMNQIGVDLNLVEKYYGLLYNRFTNLKEESSRLIECVENK